RHMPAFAPEPHVPAVGNNGGDSGQMSPERSPHIGTEMIGQKDFDVFIFEKFFEFASLNESGRAINAHDSKDLQFTASGFDQLPGSLAVTIETDHCHAIFILVKTLGQLINLLLSSTG